MVDVVVGGEEVGFADHINRLATEILKGDSHLAFLLVVLVNDLLTSSAKTLTRGTLGMKKNHKKIQQHPFCFSIFHEPLEFP